ncbi:DNA topoisomerase (ATP-hydrolyzing) [Jonesiaceae bacterium BS-20]|uniref:DNA topoisomerase (ATP-hydrolyzing) n=1 Tax=Jonesiaceae bacterium BS-20 TaxID=3120821 RepID=A0AAU7E0J5_9MICO
MARKAKSTETPLEDFTEHIIDIDVTTEMETSFLEYAYSVIYARALPDARDGLKPVQRRILYQMADMGLRPERGYVKSSRVVGEVMGKLHPHGDTAIYDALVRLAQPFSLRLPMVDGHGNFGSLDDGPAAPRYTEARLATSAMAMTVDLDQDVVDFVPNYDNRLTQPEVLPAAIPNLLVNGASGIAVGMATNLAPHNLIEVIAAARHLLKHPKATLDELMRFVPGPDLPTGGRIVGLEGIRDAYRSGRGSFRTRATTRIENVTPRRKGIIVTELPYLVGPEKVIEKIKEGVQNKKLSGISNVMDLTDRKHGLRIVIEIKTGFNPEAVLEALHRFTPMEDSFGINNVALVDGQPSTMGLKEMLTVWVDHRLDVVLRRTKYRLLKRRERQHLVEGLLRAIVDIDEVIEVIRSSDDSETARTRLMKIFDLSQIQAEYILELRLRRLTKFSRLELDKENQELTAEIAELVAILEEDKKLRALVGQEMADVAKVYGTPRRTILLETPGADPVTGQVPAPADRRRGAVTPLEIPDSPCWAMLSATGLVARTSDDLEPARVDGRKDQDVLRSVVKTSARAEIGLITSTGRLVKISMLNLPALPPTQDAPSLVGGIEIHEIAELEPHETVLALVSLAEDAPTLALGTKLGVVKRVNKADVAKTEDWEVISLKEGDEVVGAAPVSDDGQLVFLTSEALLLHFPAALVRPQGRAAGGMAGIKLGAGQQVRFFGVVQDLETATVVTIAGHSAALPGTEAGSGKVTPLTAFPAKGRATAGVRAQRFLKGEDTLTLGWAGLTPAHACTVDGHAIDLPEVDPRRDGSGVPLPAPVFAIG